MFVLIKSRFNNSLTMCSLIVRLHLHPELLKQNQLLLLLRKYRSRKLLLLPMFSLIKGRLYLLWEGGRERKAFNSGGLFILSMVALTKIFA